MLLLQPTAAATRQHSGSLQCQPISSVEHFLLPVLSLSFCLCSDFNILRLLSHRHMLPHSAEACCHTYRSQCSSHFLTFSRVINPHLKDLSSIHHSSKRVRGVLFLESGFYSAYAQPAPAFLRWSYWSLWTCCEHCQQMLPRCGHNCLHSTAQCGRVWHLQIYRYQTHTLIHNSQPPRWLFSLAWREQLRELTAVMVFCLLSRKVHILSWSWFTKKKKCNEIMGGQGVFELMLQYTVYLIKPEIKFRRL